VELILQTVILFLHGGPGSPEIAFMKETNTDIEKILFMVYWERAGRESYSKDIPIRKHEIKRLFLIPGTEPNPAKRF